VEKTSTDSTTYLLFSLRQSLYGVEALAVREILALPALTPLDEASRCVAGVVNLRGTLVPVIDLDLRFGREPGRYRLEDRLVVIEWEGRLAGILVNDVLDVRRIDAAAIEAPPGARDARGAPCPVPGARPDRSMSVFIPPGTGHRARGAAFLSGIAKAEDALVMLLDVERLLALHEIDFEPESGETGENETGPREDRDRPIAPWSEEERAVLRERARALAQLLQAQDLSDRLPLAVIRLNDEPFGIDLAAVGEFAPLHQVTPVPCCPTHIVGQMNLRGDILTLVDIRPALRLPSSGVQVNDEHGSAASVMVVRSGDLMCGVLVDEVLDVTYLRPEEVTPVPVAVRALGNDFVTGNAPFGARLLTLLDLPRLLAAGDLVVHEEP
jgi:purine-binding chemotaxis protein CheW